jgi:hypothetical protein
VAKKSSSPARRTQEKLADILFPVRRHEEEYVELDIPKEQRRLVTDSFDFTVSTLVQYIDDSDMYIPPFQRRFVWTLGQASRLIESLIIQCPIPSIYLNEEADNKLTVIDGNQRLLSIYKFVKGDFALQFLTAYPDLDGSLFADLDPRFQRHILSRPLRFIVIKKETHPQIKFDVFERINSGAVRLNAQELRHGVYYGPLIVAADHLAESKLWRDVTRIREDKRMRASELVLRFWAFRYALDSYKKPLETFLNTFAERNRSVDDPTLERWSEEAKAVATVALSLFGSLAFKTISKNGKPSSLINSALFDAEMIGISTYPDRRFLSSYPPKRFRERLGTFLTGSDAFQDTILKATSDESSVRGRIQLFRDFLNSLNG